MEGAVQLTWLALFALAFYLLLIRPQRKRQRQTMQLQSSLEVGDEVMLGSGVFARVAAEVDDPLAGDCLMVEVAPGVQMKVARGSVMRKLTPHDDEPEGTATSEELGDRHPDDDGGR